jgi:hypothetical protein
MFAMGKLPYLCPVKREISVRMIVKTMDNRIEVARGKIQVIFFPWITRSPGNLPRGILILEAI